MEQETFKHPEPSESVQRGGLRRGIYLLPSLFTVGTLVCGYFALLSTFQGGEFLAASAGAGLAAAAFDNAAKAIGWAIVFDGLDGRIARITNSSSNFGREFDSLADVITFGIAPAMLAYSWGVRSALDGAVGPDADLLRKIGWVVTFVFVICGAARLARFNTDSVKASSDRRFFVGLPIPAAAGVIAAIVHWHHFGLASSSTAFLWLATVAILGFLMVSRMKYYSFKAIDLRRRRPYATIILLAVGAWLIWTFSEPVLLTLALTYAISGIVMRIVSKVRPHPPNPKEAPVQ